MTIGKFKNLEKGCLVSYKLPGKTKAYGEFVEQVLEDGKKFYMCESLNGSKHIEKIPARYIESVLPNFLKEAEKEKDYQKEFEKEAKLPKYLKDILKLVKDYNSAEEIVQSYSIKEVIVPGKDNKTGSDILVFGWNNVIFDDQFTCKDCVELDGFIRETPTSVDIVISKPFSKVFTFTKPINGDEENHCALAKQVLANLNNIADNIFAEVKAKYFEYVIRHNALISDCEDYCDCAFNSAEFISSAAHAAHAALKEATDPLAADTNMEDPLAGTDAAVQPQTPEAPEASPQSTVSKHFILTKQSKTVSGIKCYRIEATKDLPKYGVKKGAAGGFVEKEQNLGLDGWVSDNAIVLNNARVEQGGIVAGDSVVSDNVVVGKNATVKDNATVGGNAKLTNITIGGNAKVSGYITSSSHATTIIMGKAEVSGKIIFNYGKNRITDNTKLIGTDSGLLVENLIMSDDAEIEASGEIYNISFIGKSNIFGKVRLDAKNKQSFTFKDIKSSGNLNFKASAFDSLNKSVITPAELGDKELLGNIVIKTPEDILKVINESENEFKSPINDDNGLKKYRVKVDSRTQWDEFDIPENLTSEQKNYLKKLPQMNCDSDSQPDDMNSDNSYFKQQGDLDSITRESIFIVIDEYAYYGWYGEEDQLQYIIRIDPKILHS